MNREQIENTPVGRTLDELVAMASGWNWQASRKSGKRWLAPPEHCGDFGHEKPATMDEEPEDSWWLNQRQDCLEWIVPFYSTDIAAAWELVEEMYAAGDCASIYYLQDVGELYWIAEFRICEEHGSGDSAPEAITRAYLLARLEAEA